MSLRKRGPAPVHRALRPAARFDAVMRPERLVGIGFRCWLAGYETNDINCWETGWNAYASELGPAHAKRAVGELACWVRAVHRSACRRISYFPYGCKGFCRDECVAISMVAASQHAACPAMRACAYALLDSSDIDGVVKSAANFADVLREAGHVLSDQSICDSALLTSLDIQQHNSFGQH